MAVLFAAACGVPGCFAGQLDDFEKAAVQDQEKQTEQSKDNDKDKGDLKHGHHDRDHADKSSSAEDGASSGLFSDLFTLLIVYPGAVTMSRVRGSSDSAFAEIDKREKGAPDLPMIRADLNYQHVNSHVSGIDGRLLAGYGPIAVQYRQTHYAEDAPNDSMELIQIHGLYRVSFSKKFEFGMGFGGLILDGNGQTSGFSMTYPLSIYPADNFGFNVTPAWSWLNGNLVSDYDWSASYVRKFCSLRLGYRRSRAGSEKLAGPYFGVSYHY